MYESASNSDSDCLGAITCTELLHDVLNMSLHCLLRDEKERCDVAVSISCGDLLKDFNLSFAQRFPPKVLHELSCDLGRDVFLSGIHLADHIYELFSGHALEHVALRSRFKRTLNLDVTLKRRNHDPKGI